ncbi:MAG: hypothetical protein D4R67_04985 [Bacteroidetes bacterium]|nr:MAG: hypothetical protein D4R67_04985 [Bacteroidota bacterium]
MLFQFFPDFQVFDFQLPLIGRDFYYHNHLFEVVRFQHISERFDMKRPVIYFFRTLAGDKNNRTMKLL